jgi:hypothetical protein
MLKVKVWFKVEQSFYMPEGIYEKMTSSDWEKMFQDSVYDGLVCDWDIAEVEEAEPEAEDDDEL